MADGSCKSYSRMKKIAWMLAGDEHSRPEEVGVVQEGEGGMVVLQEDMVDVLLHGVT